MRQDTFHADLDRVLRRIGRAVLYGFVAYVFLISQHYYDVPGRLFALSVFGLAMVNRTLWIAEITIAFLLLLVFIPEQLTAELAGLIS